MERQQTIWHQCTRHASQYLTANLFDRLDQLSGALPGRRDLVVPIIEEVPMFLIHAPILIVPTAEAREALGEIRFHRNPVRDRLKRNRSRGSRMRRREFMAGLAGVAVPRVPRDGAVELGLRLGDPRRPKNSFTAAQMRQAEAGTRARLASLPSRRRARAI